VVQPDMRKPCRTADGTDGVTPGVKVRPGSTTALAGRPARPLPQSYPASTAGTRSGRQVDSGRTGATDLVRVMLLAENWVTRTALRAVLDGELDLVVMAEAADGDQAVAWTDELTPDVVVFDANHPGDERTVTRLMSACRDAGAHLLVRAGDDVSLPAELAGTCVAWLRHSASPEEFVAAVRLTASGYLVRPSVFVTVAPESIPNPKLFDVLTSREHEVLCLLANGLTNAEISAALLLGESTVKTHVQNVLAKLGVRNRVTAAIYAHKLGVTSSAVPAGAVTR
jgi:DNA-binding NarL/FixJ family response regulator